MDCLVWREETRFILVKYLEKKFGALLLMQQNTNLATSYLYKSYIFKIFFSFWKYVGYLPIQITLPYNIIRVTIVEA